MFITKIIHINSVFIAIINVIEVMKESVIDKIKTGRLRGDWKAPKNKKDNRGKFIICKSLRICYIQAVEQGWLSPFNSLEQRNKRWLYQDSMRTFNWRRNDNLIDTKQNWYEEDKGRDYCDHSKIRAHIHHMEIADGNEYRKRGEESEIVENYVR